MRLAIMLAGITIAIGCQFTPHTEPSGPGPSEEFIASLDRVETRHYDIDHDGAYELFLGNPATRGNAGMLYLVLKFDRGGWQPMGELFMAPRAFRVQPLADDGSIRLLLYHRESGTRGTVATLTHDGTQFTVIASETISPGDGGTAEGRRRYAELFKQD